MAKKLKERTIKKSSKKNIKNNDKQGSSTLEFYNLNKNLIRQITLALLAISYVLYLIWGLSSNGTWDDDCPGRYLNTFNAFREPIHFVSFWNRPLFTMIFAIPVQITKYSIPIIMSGFAVLLAYYLAKSTLKQNLNYSFIVILFLLFQPYYLGIGRDAMTEPLAATIIGISYYLMLEKKWLWFAILGALLPLARAELVLHLIFWVVPLVVHKQYKYIPILGSGLVLWFLMAGMITGNWMFLYDNTLGKGDTENRYGSQPLNTYSSRYYYFLGPVVFYYFILGILKSILDKRFSLFILGQCIFGFILYTLFSSVIVLGQSAGFLRNLLPISPLVAVLAAQGFSYWIDKMINKRKSILIIYTLLISLLVGLYYNNTLRLHHIITEEIGYLHLSLFGFIVFLTMIPWSLFVKASESKAVRVGMLVTGFVSVALVSFALVSEPPNANMNGERYMINDVVNTYKSNFIKEAPRVYTSHPWFYWAGDYKRDNTKYGVMKLDSLKSAPAGTIAIWESHYSNRLGSDVPVEFMNDKSNNFVLLSTFYTEKFDRNAFVYIKKSDQNTDIDYIEHAINIAPSAYSHLRRAEFYMNSNVTEAENSIQKALEFGENAAYVEFMAGQIYTLGKKYDQALVHFDNVSEKFTEVVSWYLQKGVALFQLKRFDESRAVFDAGIKVKEDEGVLYYNAGVCLVNQQKTDESCTYFQNAKKYNYSQAQSMIDRNCK